MESEAALENTCVEKRSAPLSCERLLLPDDEDEDEREEDEEEDEEADEERDIETLEAEVLLERPLAESVEDELPEAS